MIKGIITQILEIDNKPVNFEKICDDYYIFEINNISYHCVFVKEKIRDFTIVRFMFSTEKNGEHSIKLLYNFNYPLKVKNTILNVIDDYFKNNKIDIFVFEGDETEKSRIKKYYFFALKFLRDYKFECFYDFTNNNYISFLLVKNKSVCNYIKENKTYIEDKWNEIKGNLERYAQEIINEC